MVCLSDNFEDINHFLVLKKDLAGLVMKGLVRPGDPGGRSKSTIEAFDSPIDMGRRAKDLIDQMEAVAVIRPSGKIERWIGGENVGNA